MSVGPWSCLWISFAILLSAGVAVPFLMKQEDAAVETAGKEFKRQIGEGIKLNQHGLYGVNLVECGKCSIEKLKRGPFTFGGFNALVLEDLKVVLSPLTNLAAAAEQTTPREIVGRMGLDDSFIKSQGVSGNYSALRIEGLTVSLLRGTNAVPAFSAAHGEAKRDGLHLRKCDIMRKGTNHVSRALLKMKPSLRLEWVGGTWDLN